MISSTVNSTRPSQDRTISAIGHAKLSHFKFTRASFIRAKETELSLENHPACRIANKVAMLMRYVASIPDSKSSDPVINEAMLLTLEIFQLGNIEHMSQTLATHCQQLAQAPPAARSSLQAGQWTAEGCDLLRKMGFHEKLIAILGDKLHRWQFDQGSVGSVNTFTQSLTQLANTCASGASEEDLTELAADARAAAKRSDIDRFSLAVSGLAIVQALNVHRDDRGDPGLSSDFLAHNALACFGGYLVTGGVL